MSFRSQKYDFDPSPSPTKARTCGLFYARKPQLKTDDISPPNVDPLSTFGVSPPLDTLVREYGASIVDRLSLHSDAI